MSWSGAGATKFPIWGVICTCVGYWVYAGWPELLIAKDPAAGALVFWLAELIFWGCSPSGCVYIISLRFLIERCSDITPMLPVELSCLKMLLFPLLAKLPLEFLTIAVEGG